MIRVTIEDVGKNVAGSIEIDVQKRHGMAQCTARINAPAGHEPRLREVEITGVPDVADAVWIVGEVIRRAYAFAAEAPERDW